MVPVWDHRSPMDLGLSGKVAWVTGASSGLGAAIARVLAEEGARVAISARRQEPLQAVARDIGATAYPLDVTDERAISATAERIEKEVGPIEIVVANAGGPAPGTFETTTDDHFRDAFGLTVGSAWHLARAATSAMERQSRGVIAFITSWSTKEIIEGLLLSNVMRAGVTGLAKTLSKELGPKGIRVLCVAPGRFDTERIRELDIATAERTGKTEEEVRTASLARVPLGRYGRPEELGNVIAFLVSDRASYVTGITVTVDGGQLNMVGA